MTAPTVNAQAVIDAVRVAVTAQGVPFGDSKMPARDGSKPWIVAWPDSGAHEPRSLASDHTLSVVSVCHCYGLTADAARIAAAKLADALYSLRGTTIEGRSVRSVTQSPPLPVSRDDAVNPPTYDAIVEWRVRLT